MLDAGIGAAEFGLGQRQIMSHENKAPINFTPLPREKIIAEQKKPEPPPTMSPNDQALADNFLKQIMSEGSQVKQPEEMVSKIVEKMPEEKKQSKNFLASIWESLKSYLKDLFS